jgi:hypothetical protein
MTGIRQRCLAVIANLGSSEIEHLRSFLLATLWLEAESLFVLAMAFLSLTIRFLTSPPPALCDTADPEVALFANTHNH